MFLHGRALTCGDNNFNVNLEKMWLHNKRDTKTYNNTCI